MEKLVTYTETQRSNFDPTRTTVLRDMFAKDMKRRFTELVSVIRTSVDTNDCFGLKDRPHTLQMTPVTKRAFEFARSEKKLAMFIKWLDQQVKSGLLTIGDLDQIGTGVEAFWTNKYLFDSYKRGVMRARYELIKAGADVPSMDDTGGIGMSMNAPFHIDRIGLIFTRVYAELKGITDAMDALISRILAQGIADGDGPALLARKIVATIKDANLGELGIKDALGRFIPASRRAELLARTETIRAHHLATIQEYRNWGLLDIVVKGEWWTAGDDRVCERCAALQGKIFTLDEIEPMIPLHPLCFIDPQIPIYTSKGWKEIGEVQIGDSVLTHMGRFRKVYALPRSKTNNTEVITFTFESGVKLSITSNHPILITKASNSFSRWKEAGKCTKDDLVVFLGNTCKRCKKPIPYFRKYCSRICLSKDITDRQWANPEHRENMSKKTSAQLKREYDNGTRDGYKITKAAHAKMKLLGSQGLHPFQREDVIANNKLVTNLPKHRKASSERMKANNPMNDPITVAKVQKSMQDLFALYPEKRINTRLANNRWSGKKTKIEEQMSLLLDKLGVKYVFQYQILKYYVDFAIPVLKIVIECDGEYWHQNKEYDKLRQERIENEGWFVLRYTDDRIIQCLNEVEGELSRVLCNHAGAYQFTGWKIRSIKKWKMKRGNMPLYNLSVEEDESYIAKGVVVHNCRCIALPYIEELQKYRN